MYDPCALQPGRKADAGRRYAALGRIPKADALHAGGVRADGAGIAGSLDALQRVPGVEHTLGVLAGKITLIHGKVLVLPALQLYKLPICRSVFSEGSQRFR